MTGRGHRTRSQRTVEIIDINSHRPPRRRLSKLSIINPAHPGLQWVSIGSEDFNVYSCGGSQSATGDRAAQERYTVKANASADSQSQVFEISGPFDRYRVQATVKIDTAAPFPGKGQGGGARFSLSALGRSFNCERRTAYTTACGVREALENPETITCSLPPDVFSGETGRRFTASASVSVDGKLDSMGGAPIATSKQFVSISFIATSTACGTGGSCETFPIRHVKSWGSIEASAPVMCGGLAAGMTTATAAPDMSGKTPTSPTNPPKPMDQGTDKASVDLDFTCSQVCRETSKYPNLCSDVTTVTVDAVPACTL